MNEPQQTFDTKRMVRVRVRGTQAQIVKVHELCKRKGCGHPIENHEPPQGGMAKCRAAGNTCPCLLFVAEHDKVCQCTHAPVNHSMTNGCDVVGCDCTWQGKGDQIPAAALGLEPFAELRAQRQIIENLPPLGGAVLQSVTFFMSGQARSLLELTQAANGIMGEVGQCNLAEGVERMRQQIRVLTDENKKLREQQPPPVDCSFNITVKAGPHVSEEAIKLAVSQAIFKAAAD